MADVLRKIDEIILVLASPLSLQENTDGWTEECKLQWRHFFEDLRRKLLAGEPLPTLSLAKGIDNWGIIRGDLLVNGAEMSNDMRKLKE